MKLSIVATLYHSSFYINEFHRRASLVAKQLADNDYEIILVNDGSPDSSLDIALHIAQEDQHIIVIDLSRNFGHHKAMMTGLAHAQGKYIFLIDCDLEEDPECLISFSNQMGQACCDVVYGVQEQRKGNWFERWSGLWFWFFLNKLTGLSLPQNILTARLMTSRYVEALLLHKEREVFIAGLWHITGFDQRAQTVKKHNKGKSTYTFCKKMSLLVNSITSFSNIPLVGIFYIGLLISFVAGVYIAFLVANWVLLDKPMSGWTSVMASIWLLGGMIISFIGVVGIYLSKMFSETKQRPYTIIRQIYGKK